jgi:hypothetical protein
VDVIGIELVISTAIFSISQKLFIVHIFNFIIVDKLDGVVMEMSGDCKNVCISIGII